MNQLISYLSLRLFLTLLLFFPLFYFLGTFLAEGGGTLGDDRVAISALFLLLLLLVSFMVSLGGTAYLRYRIDRLKESHGLQLKESIALFEKLCALSYSALFTWFSGEKLRKEFLPLFTDLFAPEIAGNLKLRRVVEYALLHGTCGRKGAEALGEVYAGLKSLHENELRCAEILKRQELCSDQLFDKLLDEYLKHTANGVTARSVYRDALRKNHPRSPEIVHMLLDETLSAREKDELQGWVLVHIHRKPAEYEVSCENIRKELQSLSETLGDRKTLLSKAVRNRLSSSAEENEKREEDVLSFSFTGRHPDTEEKRGTEGALIIEKEREQGEIREADIRIQEEETLFTAPPPLKGSSKKQGNTLRFLLAILFLLAGGVWLLQQRTAPPAPTAVSNAPSVTTPAVKEVPLTEEQAPPAVTQKKAQVPPLEGEKVLSTKPYTIQVAATKRLRDAKRFIRKLQKHERDVYLTVDHRSSSAENWYRIRLGFFNSREEARKQAEALKKKGYIKNFLITSFTGGVKVKTKE